MEQLPNEIICKFFDFLNKDDAYSFSKTCQKFETLFFRYICAKFTTLVLRAQTLYLIKPQGPEILFTLPQKVTHWLVLNKTTIVIIEDDKRLKVFKKGKLVLTRQWRQVVDLLAQSENSFWVNNGLKAMLFVDFKGVLGFNFKYPHRIACFKPNVFCIYSAKKFVICRLKGALQTQFKLFPPLWEYNITYKRLLRGSTLEYTAACFVSKKECLVLVQGKNRTVDYSTQLLIVESAGSSAVFGLDVLNSRIFPTVPDGFLNPNVYFRNTHFKNLKNIIAALKINVQGTVVILEKYSEFFYVYQFNFIEKYCTLLEKTKTQPEIFHLFKDWWAYCCNGDFKIYNEFYVMNQFDSNKPYSET